MDSNRYLHTQIARAICQAAYEKPLTVEEISLCTGIPAMYIEDELPRLEYGDAVRKTGNKYATEFIIIHLKDREDIEAALESMVKEIADYYEDALWGGKQDCRELGFYGSDFGMERLGHILVPYFIRQKIEGLKNDRLHLANGNFPPRKDGGHGWFVVSETADEREATGQFSTGCNAQRVMVDGEQQGHLYYYWIARYYNSNVWMNHGTFWMGGKGMPANCSGAVVPEGLLDEEETALLVRNNLIRREGNAYKMNFPCFTREEFGKFCDLYGGKDEKLDDLLARWILSVRKSFEGFVPKRLHGQINQWLSVYCGEIIGQVVEELIRRGRLSRPEWTREAEEDNGTLPGESGKPLVDGIFYLEGDYMPI